MFRHMRPNKISFIMLIFSKLYVGFFSNLTIFFTFFPRSTMIKLFFLIYTYKYTYILICGCYLPLQLQQTKNKNKICVKLFTRVLEIVNKASKVEIL
jgi:hypothetical protein